MACKPGSQLFCEELRTDYFGLKPSHRSLLSPNLWCKQFLPLMYSLLLKSSHLVNKRVLQFNSLQFFTPLAENPDYFVLKQNSPSLESKLHVIKVPLIFLNDLPQ